MSGRPFDVRGRPGLAGALCALVFLCACGDEFDAPPDARPAGATSARGRIAALPSFDILVARAAPAVVNVIATGAPEDEADAFDPDLERNPHLDFFRRFLPQGPESDGPSLHGTVLGSGFVISPDGYVLTSAHLVAGGAEVVVRLPETERELAAEVVGIDRRTDVALLKVDGRDLPVVKLGRSDRLRAGDWVAAIGSPFGFSNTITAGIVGATQRTLPDESFVPFIQTDVAVNPGNSGGPLLNLDGEVVGINSMIYSRTGGYMGVSFAVPIEVAMEVSEELRREGHVTRGRVGLQLQELTEKLADSFRAPAGRGVLVAAVEPGGSADRAGVQAGDVLLEYAGTPVLGVEHTLQLVAKSRPGDKATLQIWHNGERRKVDVTVDAAPAETPSRARSARGSDPSQFRLVVTELPVSRRRQLQIDYGLVVESVRGVAAATGLQRGDIIVTLNQTPITSRTQFDELLAGQGAGATVALRVLRGLSAVYVPVMLSG